MLRTYLTSTAVAILLAGPAFGQADKPAAAVDADKPAASSSATTSGISSPAGTAGDTSAPSGTGTSSTTGGSDSATPPSTSAGTSMGQPATGTMATTAAPGTAMGNGAFMTEQKPDQHLADNLIGTTVRNAQDENVGKVEDLILDKDHKVIGAVVSVGGFLGIGSKEVAVPLEGLQVRSSEAGEDPEILVSWTKDQLKQAPEFKTLADVRADRDRAAARSPAGTPAGTTAPASTQTR